MATSYRFTAADLETFPEDGRRYEVIDGELHVTPAQHGLHQAVVDRLIQLLLNWWDETDLGWVASGTEIRFAEDEVVIPDVLWVSQERLPIVLRGDGRLHGAPDLTVEVLSPGTTGERRDREAKLKLYSRQGVREYWIVNREGQTVQVYRREEAVLRLAMTLGASDTLTFPLLPGFALAVGRLFRTPQDVRL
jgi:Uma2 family endonuclease